MMGISTMGPWNKPWIPRKTGGNFGTSLLGFHLRKPGSQPMLFIARSKSYRLLVKQGSKLNENKLTVVHSDHHYHHYHHCYDAYYAEKWSLLSYYYHFHQYFHHIIIILLPFSSVLKKIFL
jgi:hypothetical protein